MDGLWQIKCKHCGDLHFFARTEFNPETDSEISGVGCSYDRTYHGTYKKSELVSTFEQSNFIRNRVVKITPSIPVCDEVKSIKYSVSISLPYSENILYMRENSWKMRDAEKFFELKREANKDRRKRHENDLARATVMWAAKCNAHIKSVTTQGEPTDTLVIVFSFNDILSLVAFEKNLFEKIGEGLVVN